MPFIKGSLEWFGLDYICIFFVQFYWNVGDGWRNMGEYMDTKRKQSLFTSKFQLQDVTENKSVKNT